MLQSANFERILIRHRRFLFAVLMQKKAAIEQRPCKYRVVQGSLASIKE